MSFKLFPLFINFIIFVHCVVGNPEIDAQNERLLMNYFQENGPIKWKWSTTDFCDPLSPSRVAQLKAIIAKMILVLENSNCSEIEAEALLCGYYYDDLTTSTKGRIWQTYVNGPNKEIFQLTPPSETGHESCHNSNELVGLKEVSVQSYNLRPIGLWDSIYTKYLTKDIYITYKELRAHLPKL